MQISDDNTFSFNNYSNSTIDCNQSKHIMCNMSTNKHRLPCLFCGSYSRDSPCRT